MSHCYGWLPDIPDQRDLKFSSLGIEEAVLPPAVDLRWGAPIFDQGILGSCTANAISTAYQYELHRRGMAAHRPSRLFIYYNERKMEGTIRYDSGAYIRDGFKSVAAQGACSETDWPYFTSRFARKPTQACYTSALKHQLLQYFRLNIALAEMKNCIAAGFPFVFGFSVYESFESAAVEQTGEVPMPRPDESLLGGHAVLCVGYDDSKQQVIVQNSWGAGWGAKGYFTMPYTYISDPNLCDDFWTMRLVE